MQARSRNKWGLLLTGSDSVGLRQIRGLNPTSPRKPFLLGRSIDLKTTTTIPVPFGLLSNLFPLPPRGQHRGRIMSSRRRGDPARVVVAPVHIQKKAQGSDFASVYVSLVRRIACQAVVMQDQANWTRQKLQGRSIDAGRGFQACPNRAGPKHSALGPAQMGHTPKRKERRSNDAPSKVNKSRRRGSPFQREFIPLAGTQIPC